MENNQQTYSSEKVIEHYRQMKGLFEAEEKLFQTFSEQIAGAALLDIGIGAGRTTEFLSKQCKAYTGIDYSEKFASYCQNKFPALRILHMDARNMLSFADKSFDAVNFSFNGIDYVNEEGREKILREIKRVLKPGGLFLFSTHNLHHASFDLDPWSVPGLSGIVKLKTFLKLLPYTFRRIRNKKSEVRKSDYSIVVDSAHNYSLLTYYTSPQLLRGDLLKQGFSRIQFYSAKGLPADDAGLDEWIFVSCFKKSA